MLLPPVTADYESIITLVKFGAKNRHCDHNAARHKNLNTRSISSTRQQTFSRALAIAAGLAARIDFSHFAPCTHVSDRAETVFML